MNTTILVYQFEVGEIRVKSISNNEGCIYLIKNTVKQ